MIFEDYKINKNQYWFHGTQQKIEKIKKPSPQKPFFVSKSIKYSLYYTDGHTIGNGKVSTDANSGYVLVVKLNDSDLKVFDILKQLDELNLPKLFERIIIACNGMVWQSIVHIMAVMESSWLLADIEDFGISNPTDFDVRQMRSNFFNTIDEDGGLKNVKKTLNSLKKEIHNALQIKSLRLEIVDAALWIYKNIPRRYLQTIQIIKNNSEDSTLKDSYITAALLILNKVRKMGYTAFMNYEGTKDIGWVDCIGIIDQIAIDEISVNKYTKQEAIQRFKRHI